MADESGVPPLDENDLGEPIAELREYEEAAPVGFLSRVVRSLRRKTLVSQLVTLGWSAMGEVFLEFLELIHSMFGSGRPGRGE